MVALCAVLVIALVWDMFRRNQKQDPAPASRKTTHQTDDTAYADQYEKRYKMERRRLQKAAEKPPETSRRQRINDQYGRPAGNRQESVGEKTPEQIWQEQERKRILKSRQAEFGLELEPKAPRHQGHDPARAYASKKNQGIPNEIERSRKAIEQLRSKQRSRAGVATSDGLRVEQAAYQQQAFHQAQPQNQVGQPAANTANQPLPGQYLITTGTVVRAVLDQDVMSDYTGSYRGRIIDDVYDVSQRYILIPKGCKFTGEILRISNINEPIQARMGMTAKWVILPDGNRISFEKNGILDQAGIAAIKDEVNYHFLAQFLGVAAYALLNVGSSRSGTGYNQDRTFAGDLGESLRDQFRPLAAKYLTLVPTITLRAGVPIRIFIEDDIYAYPWKKVGDSLYQAY